MKVSFFLPIRKGSERVINKNLKPFGNYPNGILELKLNQLLSMDAEHEFVLSTNDEKAIEIGKSFNDPRIKIDIRPDYLCSSSTKLSDLINYVPSIVKNDHIAWIHATTPFVDAKLYSSIINAYFENIQNNKHDSLMCVKKFQNFLWDKEKCKFSNFDQTVTKYPRTQDLKALYEVTHAAFIVSKEIYSSNNDRIGLNPFLFELDTISSFDIDWEDDFMIAEAIYYKKEFK